MTKLRILYLRACKSKDPSKRFISLYKRFYYSGEVLNNDIDTVTILNLCEAIQTLEILDLKTFILRILNIPYYVVADTTHKKIVYVLTGLIRYNTSKQVIASLNNNRTLT